MTDITVVHAQVREMESIIISHPEVEDVVVIAVDNGDGGNLLKAFVEPSEKCVPSTESIINICQSRSKYGRIPNAIIFGEIPRTPSGKVLRQRLLAAANS